MKNHKGSVPALLTLGLVLIGSLVTIGISYLTSTNKIASNPRADASCTPTEGVNQAICFCNSSNQAVIYASWDARVANCMTTGIQSYITAQSYGTDKWGYCDSTADFQSTCGSGGPVDPGDPPVGCKNTTCKAENFGLSSDPISYYENKPDIFYFQLNCGGNKHTDTEIQDTEYCGNTSGACNEIQCKQWKAQLKSLPGYDGDFMNNNSVWKKLGSEQLYTDYPCSDDLKTTYQTACMPPAPPASEAHTCDVEVQCADILGEGYTGKLYQFSDEQGSEENYYKTKSCLYEADPDKDCTEVTAPEPAEPLSGFSCSGMKSYTIPGGATCTCFFQELDGGAQLQTSYANFSNLCKNTCNGNPFLGDTGYGGGDNGYCCPKDCGG